MRVICAWCEEEGRVVVMRDTGLADGQGTSHGICGEHERAMLRKITELAVQEWTSLHRPRPARRRRPFTAATRLSRVQAAARRRTLAAQASPQLLLPFADD